MNFSNIFSKTRDCYFLFGEGFLIKKGGGGYILNGRHGPAIVMFA